MSTALCAMLALIWSAPAWSQQPSRLSLFPLEIVWSRALGTSATTFPGYDHERAYVPLRGGSLVAVTLEDGQVAWSTQGFPTTLPPATGDGVIYVAGPDGLSALSRDDGRVVWLLPLSEQVTAPPLWRAGWLLVALDSGELLSLRALDGSPVWRQHLGVLLRVTPSVDGDRVYFPVEDGRVMALDITTGQLLWEQSVNGTGSEILVEGDRLYLGSSDNFFYCLSAADGSFRWRWRTGGDIVGKPAADASRVYFISRDGVLRALSRRSGVQQWKRALPTRPETPPQLLGDVIVMAGRTPVIRGYAARTGEPVGERTLATELAAPLHLVERPPPALDLVVALNGDGVMAGAQRQVDPALLPVTWTPLPGTALPLPPPPPPAVPEALP